VITAATARTTDGSTRRYSSPAKDVNRCAAHDAIAATGEAQTAVSRLGERTLRRTFCSPINVGPTNNGRQSRDEGNGPWRSQK
jgi:hypothetical protein